MARERDEHIKKFAAEASAVGAILHFAGTKGEIGEVIIRVANEHNCKKVVLTCSKIASSAELAAELARVGMVVNDTNLKSWITQDKELDTIRAELRQKYIEADLGISEATYAIAETGTLIICGNEGNERLTAILPRLHITLIDNENIVPTLEDAVMLVMDSHGKVPHYITYLTGRNTTGDIPGALTARAQGPEEEHIIIFNAEILYKL